MERLNYRSYLDFDFPNEKMTIRDSKEDEPGQRMIVAAKNLSAGEPLMHDEVLIWGPPPYVETPICIACCTPVNCTFLCPSCQWPLCGPNCSMLENHSTAECCIFESNDIKFMDSPVPKRSRNPVPAMSTSTDCKKYNAILPLRLLQLCETNSDLWDIIQDTNANLNLADLVVGRKKHARYLKHHQSIYKKDDLNIVRFLRSKCGYMHWTEDQLMMILTCIDMRSVDRVLERKNILCVLQVLIYFSHSCVPNSVIEIDPSDNNRFYIRAAKDIAKGEPITICKVDPIDPTIFRAQWLQINFGCTCHCLRCSDPTELGTHIGSMWCQSCKADALLPIAPLDIQSPWKCSGCKKKVPFKEIHDKYNSIVTHLREADRGCTTSRVPQYFNLIENLANRELHTNNGFLIHFKFKLLTSVFSKPSEIKVDDIDLDTLLGYANDIGETISVIAPPSSRKRVFSIRLITLTHAVINAIKEGESKNVQESRKKEMCDYLSLLSAFIPLKEKFTEAELQSTRPLETRIRHEMPPEEFLQDGYESEGRSSQTSFFDQDAEDEVNNDVEENMDIGENDIEYDLEMLIGGEIIIDDQNQNVSVLQSTDSSVYERSTISPSSASIYSSFSSSSTDVDAHNYRNIICDNNTPTINEEEIFNDVTVTTTVIDSNNKIYFSTPYVHEKTPDSDMLQEEVLSPITRELQFTANEKSSNRHHSIIRNRGGANRKSKSRRIRSPPPKKITRRVVNKKLRGKINKKRAVANSTENIEHLFFDSNVRSRYKKDKSKKPHPPCKVEVENSPNPFDSFYNRTSTAVKKKLARSKRKVGGRKSRHFTRYSDDDSENCEVPMRIQRQPENNISEGLLTTTDDNENTSCSVATSLNDYEEEEIYLFDDDNVELDQIEIKSPPSCRNVKIEREQSMEEMPRQSSIRVSVIVQNPAYCPNNINYNSNIASVEPNLENLNSNVESSVEPNLENLDNISNVESVEPNLENLDDQQIPIIDNHQPIYDDEEPPSEQPDQFEPVYPPQYYSNNPPTAGHRNVQYVHHNSAEFRPLPTPSLSDYENIPVENEYFPPESDLPLQRDSSVISRNPFGHRANTQYIPYDSEYGNLQRVPRSFEYESSQPSPQYVSSNIPSDLPEYRSPQHLPQNSQYAPRTTPRYPSEHGNYPHSPHNNPYEYGNPAPQLPHNPPYEYENTPPHVYGHENPSHTSQNRTEHENIPGNPAPHMPHNPPYEYGNTPPHMYEHKNSSHTSQNPTEHENIPRNPAPNMPHNPPYEYGNTPPHMYGHKNSSHTSQNPTEHENIPRNPAPHMPYNPQYEYENTLPHVYGHEIPSHTSRNPTEHENIPGNPTERENIPRNRSPHMPHNPPYEYGNTPSHMYERENLHASRNPSEHENIPGNSAPHVPHNPPYEYGNTPPHVYERENLHASRNPTEHENTQHASDNLSPEHENSENISLNHPSDGDMPSYENLQDTEQNRYSHFEQPNTSTYDEQRSRLVVMQILRRKVTETSERRVVEDESITTPVWHFYRHS